MSDTPSFKPKLIPNLRFSVQTHAGAVCCVIEDPVGERFWRLDTRGFQLLRNMDGHSDLATLLAQVAAKTPDQALNEEEGQRILSWLAQEGLLQNVTGQPTPRRSSGRWLNQSVFLRLRLGNPQPLLERIYPWLGWITGPCAALAGLFTLLLAVAMIWPRWDSFQSASYDVISVNHWWHFLLIWWGLKAIHETSHGLTCLRYGGKVPQAGILFILFAPLGAYVDVTSCWKFPSKWERMHVTAAGILIELAVAALALIGWCQLESPAWRQLCLETALLASVATLMFNANPLIRFDGYYFLSDWLEIPNLYRRGQLAIRGLARKWLFGDRLTQEELPGPRSGAILLFGMAAFLYRIFLNLAIMLGASLLLPGLGTVLAIGLTVLWFGVPIGNWLWTMQQRIRQRPRSVLRASLILGTVGAAVLLVAGRLPVPHFVLVPGVVQPTQSTLLRAAVPGRVVSVIAEPGQRVAQGDLLMVIENRDLEHRLLQKTMELEISRIKARELEDRGEIAQRIAEQEVAEVLSQQVTLLTSRLAACQVRAPHDGQVFNFDLNELLGNQVREGTPLLTIGDRSQLEFQLTIPQRDWPHLSQPNEHRRTTLFLPGQDPLVVDDDQLRIEPQATWELSDEALAATAGGPVPVRQSTDPSDRLMLLTLEPRYAASLQIPADVPLMIGQIGQARVQLGSATIAQQLRPWATDLGIRWWHQIRDALDGRSVSRR